MEKHYRADTMVETPIIHKLDFFLIDETTVSESPWIPSLDVKGKGRGKSIRERKERQHDERR